MKKYNYPVLLFFFLMQGCDSFLDVKSDATLVVPHTIEDAQALLDDVLRMNEQTVPARGECVSDDYYLSETVFNGRPETERKFYVWDYQEYFGTGNDWSDAYAPVFNANLALELVHRIDRTEKNRVQWDNVKGSALFYRSFYFFRLLTVFALAYDQATADSALGIALRLDTDFNTLSTRSTVKQCYDQILGDLDEAVKYLPDHPRHVTRPSKGAVYGLLSHIYHYRCDYENSIKYADLALSYNSTLIDFNGDSDLLSFNTTAAPFTKYNKETIFYAELTNGFVFARSSAIVDTNLVASYDAEDLRKRAFFRMTGQDAYFKGTLTGRVARQFGGLSTSELYLNKAESLAILGSPIEAIKTLNELLEKRYTRESSLPNPTAYDPSTATQKVRDERRKELLFRGIRFMDIKRYNKEGADIRLIRRIAGQEYVLEANSRRYALPIPQDIIDITGIPQN